ncbi:MAG: GTPase Era [Tissierellia bacterium]|nr:GTPase Era [Tissierellia bacterium]
MKSGFVAVLGRPNVGKSTLLNNIMGEKLSIISNKPQTTRNKIQLIYTDDDSQIIFLDTPGIQDPRNKLGEYMLSESKSSLEDADVVMYLVDNSDFIGKHDSKIIEDLRGIKTPVVLVINKIDEINNDKLMEIIAMYDSEDVFEEIVPISAINGENIGKLLELLKDKLPEGPYYYPEDQITDQSERFIVSEIIREKTLQFLDEEVPHGINVEIESMKEDEESGLLRIDATIYAEKDSHKGIVIGKNGAMLKRIGREARKEIEVFLDTKVLLKLWVKVEKNWRDKSNKVKYFGYK